MKKFYVALFSYLLIRLLLPFCGGIYPVPKEAAVAQKQDGEFEKWMYKIE